MADEPREYRSVGEVNRAKLPPFSVVSFSDYGVSLLAVLGPDGTVIQTFREDQASQAQQAAENRRAVHMASLAEVPDWMRSKRSESNRPVVEAVPPFPTPPAIQPPITPVSSAGIPPLPPPVTPPKGQEGGIPLADQTPLGSLGSTVSGEPGDLAKQVASAVVSSLGGMASRGYAVTPQGQAPAIPPPVPPPISQPAQSTPSPPLGGVNVGGVGGVPPPPLPPQVPPAAPSPQPQPLQPQPLQPPIPPSNQPTNPPQPQPQPQPQQVAASFGQQPQTQSQGQGQPQQPQQPQQPPQQPQAAPVFGPTTAPAAPLTAAQIGALFGVSPTVQPVSQSPLTGAQIAAGLGMQQPLPSAPSPPLTGAQIASGLGMGPTRNQRRFQQAARRFRAVAPHAAAYGGFRGVARAGATALGAAFPEVAIPAVIITGIVRELADLPRELRDFAESIHAANRALIPFAPRLGIAEAQLQMSDLRRTMGMARDIEPTAVTLTGAIDEMRESLYPFRVAGRNLQNTFAAGASGVISGAANEARVIPELLEMFRQMADPEGKNAARVGEAVGAALVDILVPIIPLLNLIRGLLGIKEIAPGGNVMDAWTAMLNHEAGPGRSRPLHGFTPFNPAERRPGEIWP